MNKDTTKEIKTPEENTTTEIPMMTEEEMKKFISTMSNMGEIQGDYVYNGFLFFFQTISETVKENPVEAQDLMFHLQQHVFNNLMWESYWAFDAHRKQAHLIFSAAEPFIYHEDESEPEDKKEIANSLPFDLSEQPENCQHLNTVASQLSSVLRNPNLPAHIYNAVMNAKDEILNAEEAEDFSADLETSPEYLEKVLSFVCEKTKGEVQND